MRYLKSILLCLIATAAQASAGIDFTPTVTRYFNEGAEFSNVSFKDDKRTISLTLPRLWICHGDSSRLQLTPPNQDFAEGIIQATPTKGALPFNEANLKALEQQVLATLPPGNQGVTLVSQQENPVGLNQSPSYEFVVSYQALGKNFQRSVIFVSCPDQQLVFRFSAPKSDFDKLNRSFRQTIYSWQWAEPASAAVVAQKDQPQAVASRQ
jgi:hypothetical protein